MVHVREQIGGNTFVGGIEVDAAADGSTGLGRGLGALDRSNLAYLAHFPEPVGDVRLSPSQIHTLATNHDNSDGPRGRQAMLTSMLQTANPRLPDGDARAAARLLLAQMDQFDTAGGRRALDAHPADAAHRHRELEITFHPSVDGAVSRISHRFNDGPPTGVRSSVDEPRARSAASARAPTTPEPPSAVRHVADLARRGAAREEPTEFVIGDVVARFDGAAFSSIHGAMDGARRSGRSQEEAATRAIYTELRSLLPAADETTLRGYAGEIYATLTTLPGGAPPADMIFVRPDAGATPESASATEPTPRAASPDAPVTLTAEMRSAAERRIGLLGMAPTDLLPAADRQAIETATRTALSNPTVGNLTALRTLLVAAQTRFESSSHGMAGMARSEVSQGISELDAALASARPAAAEGPGAATADTPRAATADTPRAATADTPRAATADTPRAATADTPRAATATTPGAASPDAPVTLTAEMRSAAERRIGLLGMAPPDLLPVADRQAIETATRTALSNPSVGNLTALRTLLVAAQTRFESSSHGMAGMARSEVSQGISELDAALASSRAPSSATTAAPATAPGTRATAATPPVWPADLNPTELVSQLRAGLGRVRSEFSGPRAEAVIEAGERVLNSMPPSIADLEAFRSAMVDLRDNADFLHRTFGAGEFNRALGLIDRVEAALAGGSPATRAAEAAAPHIETSIWRNILDFFSELFTLGFAQTQTFDRAASDELVRSATPGLIARGGPELRQLVEGERATAIVGLSAMLQRANPAIDPTLARHTAERLYESLRAAYGRPATAAS